MYPDENEVDLHEGPVDERPEIDVCVECDELVEVADISIETSGAEETERHYRVIFLICGHEIATPIPYQEGRTP